MEKVELVVNVEEEDKAVIEPAPRSAALESWQPKTGLGKRVKSREVSDIDEVLDSGEPILESEIVDCLLDNLGAELMMIGQAEGKFGGGQRRVFKQTQKKTAEGNKPSFSTCIVVGNRNGYVGIGFGKSRETVPSREKALRNAKLAIIKIRRGCGSWQCGCREPHSIPFMVTGKCGSVVLTLMPAPKGTGLVVQEECQKILQMAGIRDVWSKTVGQTRTTTNLVRACQAALSKLVGTKLHSRFVEGLGVVEGKV